MPRETSLEFAREISAGSTRAVLILMGAFFSTPRLALIDLVVLHSFYTNIQTEKQILERKHSARLACFERSEILPLLGIVPLRNMPLTNNIVASLQRFRAQKFYSAVFLIK